jgi:SPP1 family predicted phage head-tail adaptor
VNIGFLDRRIVIQSASRTADVYGQTVPSWSTYATVWAALDNKAASSAVLQEQETSTNRVTWRVRSSTETRAVTPKYRISYGGDIYNILAVQEVGRKHELHFITERVVSE